MGSFTAEEFASAANAVLAYQIQSRAASQIDQARPLWDDLYANKKTFPGGNEFVTKNVKGQYTSKFVGYSFDDDVAFVNPANIKQVKAPWFEMFCGISVTHTELKRSGITISDTRGERASTNSDSDRMILTNLLEDKLQDMGEGGERSIAEICWRDGTQDPKVYPGLQSFLLQSPATGVSFGLDRAANTWWRNRSSLNIVTSTPADMNISNLLQVEVRQLRRFSTGPKHKMYAGSAFLEAWEKELRSKGNITLDGWSTGKSTEVSVADIKFRGMTVQYDPLLDDLGLTKFMYIIDLSTVNLWCMSGEDMKTQNPERPPERLVLYRGKSFTGMIMAQQLNSSGVYSIA